MSTPENFDIAVSSLSYVFPDSSPGLTNISLSLPSGSRTLLIGANGAGKTTLMRLLSGKRLAPAKSVAIGGVDPFSTGLEGVTYLGVEWVLNPIVRTDIDVPSLLASVGGNAFPGRRDELVAILDIDLRWRMHTVSDGERRRVQIAMGLLRPWNVLLLDEITVDLDLLSRKNFLDYLRQECKRRGATVVYATHILDNLVGWPTHLVHMHLGRVKAYGTAEEMFEAARLKGGEEEQVDLRSGNSHLSELVLTWLAEDLAERGPREKMARGPPETKAPDSIGGYGFETRK